MLTYSNVHTYGDHSALVEAAAGLIVETAAEAIGSRGRFLLALSGGGTPENVYRLLAGQEYLTQIDWPAVHIFWGDERCVSPDDPGSNYRQARQLLIDHVPIPMTQVQRIKGELAPGKAAADYRARLAQFAGDGQDWPVLDLVLMGLGADGHTASLFPGPPTPGEERLAAIPVTADYGGRPAQRVSLTPAVFNSARAVLFLVTGAAKAEAVAAILEPNPDPHRWPAARIKPTSGRTVFLIDTAAATLLP